MDRPDRPSRAALLEAVDLVFGPDDRGPPHRLSFSVGPGLTLVRGGDGRGKTTLLRLIAGEAEPRRGELRRRARTVFLADPSDPCADALAAPEWLAAQRHRSSGWDASLEAGLADAFGLGDHLGKTLRMLSTGTRRKLGLVAAFACGADLVLLDTPYAGLDARSRAVLDEALGEAAADPMRGVVLADHALPAGLEGVPLAGRIDLGD